MLVAAGVLAALPAGRAAAACPTCTSAVQANKLIYSSVAVSQGNFSVTGVVQGVSYDQNVIEVVAGGDHKSIHITPTTSIVKHGETAGIADLRVGVHVVVGGVIKDGQLVALTIEIK